MKNFNFLDMDYDTPPPPRTGCKYYQIQLAKELVQPIQKGMLVANFKKSTKSVDVKNADTVCKYSLEKSLKTCSEHPTRLGAYFMVPFQILSQL